MGAMAFNLQTDDPLLTIREVMTLTRCSKPHIYGMRQKGKFPKGLLLSTRKRVWKKSEVEAWIQSKVEVAAK